MGANGAIRPDLRLYPSISGSLVLKWFSGENRSGHSLNPLYESRLSLFIGYVKFNIAFAICSFAALGAGLIPRFLS
jgi:hypothetical protein